MRADLFDYDFDPAHVAQSPATRRSDSRLMLLPRDGERSHHRFAELPELIRGDELFVVNDTRVLPARLFGEKPTGGRVELLLVEPVLDASGGAQEWLAMARANRPLKPGTTILVDDVAITALERAHEGLLRLRFPENLDLDGFLERAGSIPLPPYIRRDVQPADASRYQTVFAERPGAVAAPTAGLHFSDELCDELRRRGARFAQVTLHVGPGTFRPMSGKHIETHRMHTERYELPLPAATAIREARAAGRPIVAVGTTVVRTLEAAALAAEAPDELVRVGSGSTDLFIRPGFPFRVVDSLITNFHWPRSTLLVLVSALAGRERILAAYEDALTRGYRLFSYGDSMWIR